MNPKKPFILFYIVTALFFAGLDGAGAETPAAFLSGAEQTAAHAGLFAAAGETVRLCEAFLSENPGATEEERREIAQATAAVLDSIRLTPLSGPEETTAGNAFAGPFTASIVSLNGAPEPGEALQFTASFPENGAGKRITAEFRVQVPSGGGPVQAAYLPPAPPCGVTGTLEIRPAFLDGAPQTTQLLEEFAPETSRALRAEFPYRVAAPKNRPTVISLLDYDRNGRTVADSPSAHALLAALIRLGFRGTGMADFPPQIDPADEPALYDAAAALFGGNDMRYIYGTVHTSALEKNAEGGFTAVLSASIHVYDFRQKEKTAAYPFRAAATGETERQALENAEFALCEQTIAPALEYGM